MRHLDEVADLKAAFEGWSVAGGDSEIRAAVRALTTTLKSAGWPVEAIIVLIKKTGFETRTRLYLAHSDASGAREPEHPIARAVRWSIECYYEHQLDLRPVQ